MSKPFKIAPASPPTASRHSFVVNKPTPGARGAHDLVVTPGNVPLAPDYAPASKIPWPAADSPALPMTTKKGK